VSSSEIGLPTEVQNHISRNMLSIDPIPYMKQIKRPFIKHLQKLYLKHRSRRNLSNVKNYYLGVLIEAYELRNMKIHSGRCHKKLEMKLVHLFPRLVNRFRNVLLHECKNIKSKNFDELIFQLNDDANRLLRN